MTPTHSLTDLVDFVLRGTPVLLPTDTVPALAIKPSAAEAIWRLKQRPTHKPLILMGADLAQMEGALGIPWLPQWKEEANRVWPGPVTLVIPIEGPLRQELNPNGASLGLRVPACEMTQELLRLSGPLATTSINRSGEPAALTAAEAGILFPELPLLGPIPWPSCSGIPSEVRAWEERGWRVLRPRSSSLA